MYRSQFLPIIITTRYFIASFLGPLLILSANQALRSSIGVLSSGDSTLYYATDAHLFFRPSRLCLSEQRKP
jgi:hypothetical protein